MPIVPTGSKFTKLPKLLKSQEFQNHTDHLPIPKILGHAAWADLFFGLLKFFEFLLA